MVSWIEKSIFRTRFPVLTTDLHDTCRTHLCHGSRMGAQWTATFWLSMFSFIHPFNAKARPLSQFELIKGKG
ncbi:MAG TPA: hypothetical protein DDZ88_06060 [Verrucomicrobiales bacterium]|nr:hypothetical protein [Verrucomicrobiales bacterium]